MVYKATMHVALLRGINVGGKNKLPMKDLTELVEAAGGEAVRTYIQSGNVVFGSKKPKAVVEGLEAALAERFGHEMPVVLRSAAQLERAIADYPFAEADEKTRQVGFLSARAPKAKVRALDPERSPGDHFEVVGEQIHLWCPNGFGKSKLTNAWFDRQLGVVSTFRNWRTTLKLLDMASG